MYSLLWLILFILMCGDYLLPYPESRKLQPTCKLIGITVKNTAKVNGSVILQTELIDANGKIAGTVKSDAVVFADSSTEIKKSLMCVLKTIHQQTKNKLYEV